MKKWIVELLKKVFQLLLAVVLDVAVCTVAFSHRKDETRIENISEIIEMYAEMNLISFVSETDDCLYN